MLSFTTTQQTIVDSKFKKVDWLFKITDKFDNLYHWSTKAIPLSTVVRWTNFNPFGAVSMGLTWDAYVKWANEENEPYSFKIIDFAGVEMYRNKAEMGLVAANTLAFTVINKDSEYNPKDFEGGTVRLTLRVSDGINSEIIRRWRFTIKKTEPEYQKFRCICEDWLQNKLRGDYPNTKFIRDLWDTTDINQSDNVCEPVPFGTPYVPIRSVYISSAVSLTGTDISAIASANGSRCIIKRNGTNDFKLFGEGAATGRLLTISGFTEASNNGTFTIAKATAQTIELNEEAGIVDEAAGDSVTLSMGSRYYVLGRPTTPSRKLRTGSSVTYSITEVRSPRAWGRASTWGLYSTATDPVFHKERHEFSLIPIEFAASSAVAFSESTRFPQATKTTPKGESWRVFQPIIADANEDGDADSCGVWLQGSLFLDMPTQFTRSDTAIITNPADILKFILSDMGIDNVDLRSFAIAAAQFNSWGLSWNGACWYKEQRKRLLSKLLLMCHSNLVSGESIELYANTGLSQKTITAAEIMKQAEIGEGSFAYSDIRTDPTDDCGYIAWQKTGESQDAFIKTLIPVKNGVFTRISKEVCELPWVQDSQAAQRLGIFYFQRKLAQEAEVAFRAKGTCIGLNPGDVVRIEDENLTGHRPYGGGTKIKWGGLLAPVWAVMADYIRWDSLNYDVLVDSIRINKDLSIDFRCTRHSVKLDDWENITPAAISPSADDISKMWMPSVAGPLSDEYQSIDASLPWKTYLTVSPISYQADYQNIQTAVNALKDSGASGLFLKNGSYLLSDTIHLPNRDIEIIGESSGSVIIYANDYHNVFKLYNRNKRYLFDSFTIFSRGDGTQDVDEAMIFSQNTTPSNLSITIKAINFFINGYFDQSTAPPDIKGDKAIRVIGVANGNEELIVEKCVCRKGTTGIGGTHFISTSYINNIIIRDNYIGDIIQNGIRLNKTINLTVSCNYFDQWRSQAIFIDTITGGGSITSNRLVHNKNRPTGQTGAAAVDTYGIYIYSSVNIACQANVIECLDCQSPRRLIYIDSCSKTTISNNLVSISSYVNPLTYGIAAIYLGNSSNSVINNNVANIDAVETATNHYGLVFINADNCVVNGNFNNLVNTGGTDYGIYFDVDSGGSYGGDNVVINAGTACVDSGTNTIVVNGTSY